MKDNLPVLKDAWKALEVFRRDIGLAFPDIARVEAVRFRGFNEKSPNSSLMEPGQIHMWVNLDRKTVEHNALFKTNAHTLKKIWDKLFAEFGDELEHVWIVPEGSGTYATGIYLQPIDVNDQNMPRYQPMKSAVPA